MKDSETSENLNYRHAPTIGGLVSDMEMMWEKPDIPTARLCTIPHLAITAALHGTLDNNGEASTSNERRALGAASRLVVARAVDRLCPSMEHKALSVVLFDPKERGAMVDRETAAASELNTSLRTVQRNRKQLLSLPAEQIFIMEVEALYSQIDALKRTDQIT